MDGRRFDPARLEKLNDPRRLVEIPPDYIWGKLDMHPPPEAAFIEIGAGTGMFSRYFAGKTGDGILYACDISPVMVSWMKDNITDPSIVPMLMDDNSVPLADGIAHLVYMINLHHELVDPVLMMKEAYRLLKPMGRVFVVDWKKQSMPRGPRVDIRHSTAEIATHLIEAGFRDPGFFDGMPFQMLVTAWK